MPKKKLFRSIYKLLVAFLVLIALLLVSSASAINQEAVGINAASISQYSAEEYRIAPNHLFPFIYTHEVGFEWFVENVIGPNNCEVDYLYVKNKTSGQIVQILDEKVSDFRSTKDCLFCVTEDDQIVYADFSGSVDIPLYQAEHGDIQELEYYNGVLYFLDGSYVVQFDIATRTATDLMMQGDICDLYAYDDGELILYLENSHALSYSVSDGATAVLSTADEIDALIYPAEETTVKRAVPDALSPNAAVLPLQIQPEFPFSDYPVGAYFNNGSMCDHPPGAENPILNCRSYAGSSQCDGFARFAHERYNHVEDWSRTYPYRPAGDSLISSSTVAPVRLGNEEKAREFFATMLRGAFVRYANSETDYDGHHSIAYGGSTSDGIMVYECNQDWQCGIDYREYKYTTFNVQTNYPYGRYPWVVIYVNHHYQSATYYSAQYHKVVCSTAGCDAYIYEMHRTNYPDSLTTCSSCG